MALAVELSAAAMAAESPEAASRAGSKVADQAAAGKAG